MCATEYRRIRRSWQVPLVALAALCWLELTDVSVAQLTVGRVEHEVQSDYSHIRVRRHRNIRTLTFVRDSGEEALESRVDLTQPHRLHFDYLRYMFLSYVVQTPSSEDSSVLIVGLGGGSMVHFLRRYDPQTRVDAVEIDPQVVDIARRYFSVPEGDGVTIHTADAFDFLQQTQQKYGVIYMDAFLKPSADTDSTGVPLELRTQQFYQHLQTRLSADGMVVFNLNPHDRLAQDVAAIRRAFPQTYVFGLPRRRGVVVVASTASQRVSLRELTQRARTLDRTWRTGFSFQQMIRSLRR